jgi:hypothetical protein
VIDVAVIEYEDDGLPDYLKHEEIDKGKKKHVGMWRLNSTCPK